MSDKHAFRIGDRVRRGDGVIVRIQDHMALVEYDNGWEAWEAPERLILVSRAPRPIEIGARVQSTLQGGLKAFGFVLAIAEGIALVRWERTGAYSATAICALTCVDN